MYFSSSVVIRVKFVIDRMIGSRVGNFFALLLFLHSFLKT